MTGIVAAISGTLAGLNYASGLYGPFGADPLPATATGTSIGGSTITINYTWLGYLRPSISGTNTMTINSVWDQLTGSSFGNRNADWGGSPSSISAIWVGSLAISGYTIFNANAASNNNTVTYSPTLTAGVNYPVRYNWQASLPFSATAYFDFNDFTYYNGWTTGSCSFSVSNGAGFYNSVTNGF
jgi:hypothetical protein